jgi:hypothetical protein
MALQIPLPASISIVRPNVSVVIFYDHSQSPLHSQGYVQARFSGRLQHRLHQHVRVCDSPYNADNWHTSVRVYPHERTNHTRVFLFAFDCIRGGCLRQCLKRKRVGSLPTCPRCDPHLMARPGKHVLAMTPTAQPQSKPAEPPEKHVLDVGEGSPTRTSACRAQDTADSAQKRSSEHRHCNTQQ